MLKVICLQILRIERIWKQKLDESTRTQMYLYGLMAVHRAEEATGQQLGCCAGAGVGAVPRRRPTGRCGVDPVTPRLGLSERWRSGGQERAVLR